MKEMEHQPAAIEVEGLEIRDVGHATELTRGIMGPLYEISALPYRLAP